MPVSAAELQFLNSLVDPDPSWGGLGARRVYPDRRDYPVLWHPFIAAAAAALPPSASLLGSIELPRLDQGQEGSCTCFSTDGVCEIAHRQTDGTWPAYNGHELYAEAGGYGESGADPRTVLSICVHRGVPLASGMRDPIVKSYLFIDRTPGVFRTQVKAAIAAGHPVLIGSLLPIPFGWNTGTVLSTGYHQYDGVGYYTDQAGVEWLELMNSWGPNWPGDAPAGTPPGVGRIRFDTLEMNDLQAGYTYGIVPTTATIVPPPPPPVPVPVPPPVPIPIPPPVPVPPSGAINVHVSAPPQYHGGLVMVQLSQASGQYLPPGTEIAVSALTPDGRLGTGGVRL